MQAWRFRIGWIAFASALSPAILAYAAALVNVRANTASVASEPATPNPAKAPDGVLGPAELLVCHNPGWAGTALFWFVGGVGTIIAFAALVTALWPREPSKRAVVGLRLVSFAVGLPLAWPWISVLIWA